ncbi:MAG TPA: hypothetical protein VFE53_22400 [Mucilaginibacter sp.]|nr:hypothetical protein [Mucilaginibacter sp.]
MHNNININHLGEIFTGGKTIAAFGRLFSKGCLIAQPAITKLRNKLFLAISGSVDVQG